MLWGQPEDSRIAWQNYTILAKGCITDILCMVYTYMYTKHAGAYRSQ